MTSHLVDQPSVSSRGRPRAYDQDAVLDTVVQLFWNQGYEATSLADIVESTGLSKSSLYSAFGSKDELFDRALNRYVDARAMMISSMLGKGTAGLEDLDRFFEALWTHIAEVGDHRGCLAVNTSTELGIRDDRIVATGARYRRLLRKAMTATLKRAADQGEIDYADVARYSSVLISSVLGLAVVVRSGATDDEILEHLKAVRELVSSWRKQ